MGTHGIYTHTVAYEKDPECMVCSSGVPVEVRTTPATPHAAWSRCG